MEKDNRKIKIFKIAALFVGGWLTVMITNNLFIKEPANSVRTWTIILGTFLIESLIVYVWVKDVKKTRLKLAILFPLIVLLTNIAIIFFLVLIFGGWAIDSS